MGYPLNWAGNIISFPYLLPSFTNVNGHSWPFHWDDIPKNMPPLDRLEGLVDPEASASDRWKCNAINEGMAKTEIKTQIAEPMWRLPEIGVPQNHPFSWDFRLWTIYFGGSPKAMESRMLPKLECRGERQCLSGCLVIILCLSSPHSATDNVQWQDWVLLLFPYPMVICICVYIYTYSNYIYIYTYFQWYASIFTSLAVSSYLHLR